MRRPLITVLLLTAGGWLGPSAAADSAADAPRVQYTINDGWRYADGPVPGAERPGHDAAAWQRVDLPHTWNAGSATGEDPDCRRGVGWYRRPLEAMDRVGLVGWEEIPVVNLITLSEAFGDHAERTLREMIRQHYNHPSIVFWSR